MTTESTTPQDVNLEMDNDDQPLNSIQAARLAGITGISARELVGLSLSKIADKFNNRISRETLELKRICGRIVKKNPITGVEEGVPFATIKAYDVDCSFLGYFPKRIRWSWLYPFRCNRELLRTVKTDACGNFCIRLPFFEIDWIVRYRRVHVLLKDMLLKPSLRDLIDVSPIRPTLPNVRRFQDILRQHLPERSIVEQMLGVETVKSLATLQANENLTTNYDAMDDILDSPAFPEGMVPPASEMLTEAGMSMESANILELLGIGVETEGAEALDPNIRFNQNRYIGPLPFPRTELLPEFVPIIDVPDVILEACQDVDGDGDEEIIYSENYFDVRWNTGSIPNVKLYARSNARTNPLCNPPLNIPCGTPAIAIVGRMPIVNPTPAPPGQPYINTSTGYAVRPNRPHSSGRADQVALAAVPSEAPVTGVLNLWGCFHNTSSGAPVSYYRVMDEVSNNGGTTFTTIAPIHEAWSQFRLVGTTLQYLPINADSNGWYPVVPMGQGWLPGERWMLEWKSAATGQHRLTLQLANAAKAIIETRPPVLLQVDNSSPVNTFQKLEWSVKGSGVWTEAPLTCPTIRRNSQPIQIRVRFTASVRHLRSIHIGVSGCGAAAPVLVRGFEPFQTGVPAGTQTDSYWHKNVTDNLFSNSGNEAIFELTPTPHLPGAYSIVVTTYSRAFRPEGDGHDYAPNNADVSYNPVALWTNSTLPIAIVD